MEGKDKEGKEWFYTDQVKEHFFTPKNILTDDEEKDFKADGVGEVGSPACGDVMKIWIKVDKEKDIITECRWKTFGCFKKDELIASPDGFIPINKIKAGDKVFNHRGEETFVEEFSKRSITGSLLKITPLISKFNAITLTDEHPVLAIKRSGVKGSRSQRHTSYLRIDKAELIEKKPIFILAKSLEKGDYLVYQPPKRVKDLKNLSKDDLKLLGFYLSEGYFAAKERSSGKYGLVAFAFNKSEKKYIDELKSLLEKKFGRRPSERIRGNVSETYLCSRKAIRFFNKYCGHMARHKFIHENIMQLPIKKQEIFLEYYFKGDGHLFKDKRKNRINQHIMTTASEQLALQLQQLIARIGHFATVSKRKTVPSKIDGRLIKSQDSYVISYIKVSGFKSFAKKSGNYFLVPIGNIKREKYKGYVYNLQVHGIDKSYLAKGFAVHNCASAIASTSMLSTMVKDMKIDEALKIKPKDIIDKLGGLPPLKVHCSVLGDKALRAAINDYFKKSGQEDRIK